MSINMYLNNNQLLEQIDFRLSLIDSEMKLCKEMLENVRIAYKNSEPELWEQDAGNSQD